MTTETITVDRKALHKVLQALVGPGHLIRELQHTRSLHKMGHPNPIDTLIEQYEAGGVPQAADAPDAVVRGVEIKVPDGAGAVHVYAKGELLTKVLTSDKAPIMLHLPDREPIELQPVEVACAAPVQAVRTATITLPAGYVSAQLRDNATGEVIAEFERTPGVTGDEVLTKVLPEASTATGCQGGACGHASDCAQHNEPAMPAGPCDCIDLGDTVRLNSGGPDMVVQTTSVGTDGRHCQCTWPNDKGEASTGVFPLASVTLVRKGAHATPLPKASPATKGICNDERMCAACFSGQGQCETAKPAAVHPDDAAGGAL